MQRRIGERYELTNRLGKGGMGEVWAARDLRLGRPVAVKFLAPGARVGDMAKWEQRFVREAALTARIGHPGVPDVIESGRLAGDQLYLVMDLVPGQTLSRLLKDRGPFPVHMAARVADQTADVLAHAHRLGVVHRDLKPSNLMLTPNGTVKVLDFGIASALEPDPDEPKLTATNDVLGTPGFISPEQADGTPASARSDLYALGCVLYEIVSGKPPFTAGTAVALMYHHVHEEAPALGDLRPDAPADFAHLVMRLLAKDPSVRLSTEEVRRGVLPWLGGPRPSELPGRRPHPRGDRPQDRQPAPSRESPADHSPVALDDVSKLAADGKPAQAAALLEKRLSATRGPLDDAALLPQRLALCRLLVQADDFRRARDDYVVLREALRTGRPETDRDVLECRAGAALCLAELGRTPEALDEYRGLLPAQRRALGPTDRAVFDTRFRLALLVARAGRHREAREQLVDLRADLTTHGSPDDKYLTQAEHLIARLDRLVNIP
jgi:eukaryotic-like serine/threonine-protein kinase